MTDQSLNVGLDLEEQNKPASNVDIPPNPDIVGEINSQAEVVDTNTEENSVEELREDLASSYETLDNLMDIRTRLKAHKLVNQDFALEALGVDPQITLPHTKSYTEGLTRVNYKESLEAVESSINSALSVIKDKSVDLDKQILINMPPTPTGSDMEEFEDCINQFIQVNGLNEISNATLDPETKAILFEALSQNLGIAKLLNSPQSLSTVCDSINELACRIDSFSDERDGLSDKINTDITNANNEASIEAALKLNEAIAEFSDYLEARGLYSEVGQEENIDSAITQLPEFYFQLRSYASKNNPAARRSEYLVDMKKMLEQAAWRLVNRNHELQCPDSLTLDQKTVLVNVLTGLAETKKLGTQYAQDAIGFIQVLMKVLTLWAKGLDAKPKAQVVDVSAQ